MVLFVAGSRLAAQTAGPRPTVVVLNLRFDGEHANVLQASDTAVVAAATSKLLATLRASELVTLVDSSAVAAAVAAAGAGGAPCGHPRARGGAPPPGAPPGPEGGPSELSDPLRLPPARPVRG